MLDRKRLVLAAIESTYGTDVNPTGAANAMLTKGAGVQLMQGQTVNRDLDRPALGNDITYHVGPYTTVSFQVELAGSGAVDAAPAYGPLLRACGFAETVTPTTGPVEYDPVSDGFESATLYFYRDKVLHKLLGARGSVKLLLSPGGLPYLDFAFTGLRVEAAAATLPAVDWSAFQVPKAVNDGNTPTFTLHGHAPNMTALELDLGNQVAYRNLVGQESVEITDRAPAGNCTIEEPEIGTKDYHAIIASHATGALQFVHGSVAGEIVQVDAPHVQLLQPSLGESDGVATLAMNLSLVPSDAGDDEIKITVK